MRRSFYSVVILQLLALAAFAQSVNTNIVGGVVFDGEPYLAVNPINQNNMVVAWMSEVIADKVVGIRTKRTTDGGASWTDQNILPHFGTLWHSADVSMAFTNTGTLYICYIDYRQSPDSGGIYVARSTDGGASWGAPVKSFSINDVPEKRPIDRPWLVVDRSPSSSQGTLYITTKPAPWVLPPNRPYFKRSTDSGQTWSAIVALDGDPYPVGNLIPAPMASPTVTSDGKFAVVYPSYQVGKPVRYVFAGSGDLGNTFSRSIVIEANSHPIQGDTLSKLGYHLVADPNDSKRLAFIAPTDLSGDWDVMLITSADGGNTWGAPVRVNDDQLQNGVWQDLVWCNYDQKGNLVAAWRDRRNGAGNGYSSAADIYFAISKDNGKTVGKNIRLSNVTAPYNQVLNGAGNDFQCVDVVGDSLCCVWGDMRNGKLSIYFVKAAVSDGIASVHRVNQEESLEIFPTTVTTSFKCSFPPTNEKITCNLADMRGNTFTIEPEFTTESSCVCKISKEIPSGLYIVQISIGNSIIRKKISIIR